MYICTICVFVCLCLQCLILGLHLLGGSFPTGHYGLAGREEAGENREEKSIRD